eukprot:428871-Pelagomonas_calceolata.AAC.4
MEHVAADAAATRVEADMRLGELALGTITSQAATGKSKGRGRGRGRGGRKHANADLLEVSDIGEETTEEQAEGVYTDWGCMHLWEGLRTRPERHLLLDVCPSQ